MDAKKNQISFRLPPDAAVIIDSMCVEDLRSPTDIVRIGIIYYCEKHHPDKAIQLRELIRP